jgi:hypothetical protein
MDKFKTFNIKDLKPVISDSNTPILESVTNELLSDLMCEYSLVNYYNLAKKILKNKKNAFILLKKDDVKRIIKRFIAFNNEFLYSYKKLSYKFNKSLLRDRYFENKKLINKLIRLVKSKKFMI